MITWYFSFTVNPDGATYMAASIVHIVGGKRLLRVSYYKSGLDGHHRCRSVEILRYGNGAEVAAKPLRKLYAI